MHELTITAIPVAAIEIAKTSLIPAMYAARMCTTWSDEKTALSSVAPAAITRAGSKSGAENRNVEMSVLPKADCAAESRIVPPIHWKTMKAIRGLQLLVRKETWT